MSPTGRPTAPRTVPALYRCEITHLRRSPLRHRVRHRTYLWLIDPAAPPRLPRALRPLARFDPRDHFDGTAPTLAAGLARFLRSRMESPPDGPALMLTHARVLGYVFNPLTLYWCHHRDGSPGCVVAEVHNTYGKRHLYLLQPDATGAAHTAKDFPVSPFFPVAGGYRMRLPLPGERLRLTVTLEQPGQRPFTAAVTGTRSTAGPLPLLRAAARHPLSTLAVSAAIRAHGIALYLRGLPVRRHEPPAAPPPAAATAPLPSSAQSPAKQRTMRQITPPRPLPADPARWEGVATVPAASRPRTALTERLVRRAVARMPLRVVTPAGPLPGPGGPRIDLHDPDAFYRRLGTGGTIGFGESYLAGEWDAPDLVAALTVLAGHTGTLVPAPLQRLRRLWAPRQPATQHNAPDAARENIRRHYDLSNDLFALFLDDTLTYSAALFRSLPARREHLADAQHRKIDRLLDLADVGPGTRLLEIGTGWGELALRAARRGARVDTLTLSAAQRDLAEQRIREAGAADRVTVRLQDYRELADGPAGRYDAVVSVEMIEAVGVRGWPGYFRTLDRVLAPGGRIALQAITMPHERMLASHTTHTWIQKYVFPGGQLPSTRAIAEAVARHTSLRVTRREPYGPHYAETLRLWRERFTEQAAAVTGLGFDATFRRMWTFYLAYCEAGFRSGYLDVQQFLLTKGTPA